MELNLETVQEFSKHLKNQGRQPATIESYTRDALGFVEHLIRYGIAFGSIEPNTLLQYRDILLGEANERENSVRRKIIGIRQFFRFIAETQNFANSPLDAVPIPLRDESLPAKADQQLIDRLLELAGASHPILKAKRDLALIALLAFEGLKAGEVINLTWFDYLYDYRAGSLKIRGKRSRVIRLDKMSNEFLRSYMEEYHAIDTWFRDEAPQKTMFISFKGRDSAIPVPHITRHGLKFILYELGEQINFPTLNTETLRHYATDFLLRKGMSGDEIMAHFGLKRIGNIAKHIAASSAEVQA
jgi:site-specific recombinase XerD